MDNISTPISEVVFKSKNKFRIVVHFDEIKMCNLGGFSPLFFPNKL